MTLNWHDFLRDYSFDDSQEVYTNGSRLIPVFRVEQLIEHLLKAQEPRLITEADFENADPYGYLSVWVEDKDDNEIICDCITKYAITEPDEDYHYRYWTSRPTDEQRKAVKWE